MESGNDKGRLSDHPVIILLGVIASIVGIFVFLTGYDNIIQIFNHIKQTPIPTSVPSSDIKFHAESLASQFILNGELEGEYVVLPDSIEVIVTKASFYSPGVKFLYLKAGQAISTSDSWEIINYSESTQIDKVIELGQEFVLTSLRFSIPRSQDTDLSNSWLVFELGVEILEDGSTGTTYIHCDDIFHAQP